jgi:hypothetical protein
MMRRLISSISAARSFSAACSIGEVASLGRWVGPSTTDTALEDSARAGDFFGGGFAAGATEGKLGVLEKSTSRVIQFVITKAAKISLQIEIVFI